MSIVVKCQSAEFVRCYRPAVEFHHESKSLTSDVVAPYDARPGCRADSVWVRRECDGKTFRGVRCLLHSGLRRPVPP